MEDIVKVWSVGRVLLLGGSRKLLVRKVGGAGLLYLRQSRGDANGHETLTA